MSTCGIRLNRSAIGEFFGVALPTVDAWKRAGCPVEKEGRNVMFNSAAVSKWLRERDVEAATSDRSQSIEESNRRRAAAEAGLAEIKLAQVCREVVRVADVAAVVGDDYASLRSRLLSVAGHVEQRVAHLVEPDTLAKVTALVRDEVCEALEELSGANEIVDKVFDDAA